MIMIMTSLNKFFKGGLVLKSKDKNLQQANQKTQQGSMLNTSEIMAAVSHEDIQKLKQFKQQSVSNKDK